MSLDISLPVAGIFLFRLLTVVLVGLPVECRWFIREVMSLRASPLAGRTEMRGFVTQAFGPLVTAQAFAMRRVGGISDEKSPQG
jgi:hypothetical protein